MLINLNTFNTLKKLLVITITSLVFSSLYAGQETTNILSTSVNVKGLLASGAAKYEVGSFPGEIIDKRTGNVAWSITDFVVPGNGGLDIVLSRSRDMGDNLGRAMGDWALDLPRIIINNTVSGYTIGAKSDGLGICMEAGPRVQAIANANGESPESTVLLAIHQTYPKLVMPGGNVKDLLLNHDHSFDEDLYRDRSFSYNGIKYLNGYSYDMARRSPRPYFNVGKSAEAEYVTKDNWLVDCIDSGDKKHGFLVTAPNGTEYKFINYSKGWGDYHNGLAVGQIVALVTQIKDIHGNTLNFNYTTDKVDNKSTADELDEITTVTENGVTKYLDAPRRARLSSITASDGRVVTFEYGQYVLKTLTGTSDARYDFVTAINSEGRRWEYAYEYKNHGFYLSRVNMPDGRYWAMENNGPEDGVYESVLHYARSLSGNTVVYNPRMLNKLSAMKLPTGARVEYSYAERFASDFFDTYRTSAKIKVLNTRSVLESINTYNYTKRSITLDGESVPVNTTTITGSVINGRYKKEEYDFHDGGVLNSNLRKLTVSEVVDDVSTVLRQEEYYWEQRPELGVVDVSFQELQDGLSIPKVLSLKKIDGRFTQSRAQHTDYGSPQSILSTGIDDAQVISYSNDNTYYTNTDNWVLDVLANETLNDPVYGNSVTTRSHYSTGLINTISKNGISERFEYHSTGDLHKRIWKREANGSDIQSVFTNYKRGKPQNESHPNGISIARSIHDDGTLEWQDDAKGNRSSFTFDALGKITSVTLPGHAIRNISWNSASNSRVEMYGDYKKTTVFDGLGREVRTIDEDVSTGQRIHTTTNYDLEGNVSFTSRPFQNSNVTATPSNGGVNSKYDVLGRVVEISDSTDSSVKTKTCYDSLCGEDSFYGTVVTDAMGYTVKTSHRGIADPSQRVASSIIAQSKKSSTDGTDHYVTTDFVYDGLNNIRVATQGGVQRSYVYNDQKLLWRVNNPETGETVFTYDAAGNRKTSQVGASAITTYLYDDLNRLDYVDYPVGTDDIDYIYDANGSVIKLIKGDAVWDYTHHADGSLKTESLSLDGKVFNLTYSYKKNTSGKVDGAIASITYPSGENVLLEPDAFGRSKSIPGYVASAEYHANGTAKEVAYSNGVITTYTLDNRQLPKNIKAIGSNKIIDLTYSYDNKSNTQSITDGVNGLYNRSMSYDGLDRLISASGAWGDIAYVYDDDNDLIEKTLVGNKTTYTYGSINNRLKTSTSGKSYSYDAYGNIISNGINNYTFSDASNLVSVSGSATANYKYDGNNLRVSSNINNIKKYSIYSSAGLLMHTYSSKNNKFLSSDHIYLNGHLIAKKEKGELDRDGDLIPDAVESNMGLNRNDSSDAAKDNDNDGLSNLAEYQAGTNANTSDTDGDGIDDKTEIENGTDPTQINPELDLDGDGLTDEQEQSIGTNPRKADTDGDGISDKDDTMPLDFDNDGLTDTKEAELGTDPRNPDTDHDGKLDGADDNPLFNPVWVVIIFAATM